jgi:hypothetical protein
MNDTIFKATFGGVFGDSVFLSVVEHLVHWNDLLNWNDSGTWQD